jgi:hypothetical protein
MAPLTDAEREAIQRKLEEMIEEIEDAIILMGDAVEGVAVERDIISRATGAELRLRVSVDLVQAGTAA